MSGDGPPARRRGRALKPGKGKPAVFVPKGEAEPVTGDEDAADAASRGQRRKRLEQPDDGSDRGVTSPPEPPPPFDPKPVIERLNIWWQNGKDRFFHIRKDPLPVPVLLWNDKDLKRALRLLGITNKTEGRTYSQADLVMAHIQENRMVDYAGPLCGKRVGVFDVQGRRVLVTSTFRLIEPAAGEWPTLHALLSGMLTAEGENQTAWFFAWLKVAIEALRKGETRPGHALIFAGPSNCGKSLVQEHVITPLLGGRSADPTKYLLGQTTFNAEMAGAEHLCMQEMPSGLDFKSRNHLGDELKRLIATESQALHPKYCDAITYFPWWRVTLSVNNNVDRLKTLPPLTADFGDKILLLFCESRPMPMRTVTPEERTAFIQKITSELPAFVAFLLSWEIPRELCLTRHAARFGHDHFHHPQLAAALFDQEPQSALLYILDNVPDLYGQEGVWGWDKAESLREWLCDDAQCGRFAAQARKIFSFANACGTYLSKLQEKFPKRFESKHTNAGNVWLVRAPKE